MTVKVVAAAIALHLFIVAPMAAQAPQAPSTTAGSDLPSGAIDIASPDGTARTAMSADDTSVAVWRTGEQIVAPSPVGLDLQGIGLGPLTLIGVKHGKHDRTIPLTATRANVARDEHNGASITFSRRLTPVVR